MKTVTITLDRGEIMSDIVSAAHVVGRRVSIPGQEEKAADIQTPEEGPDKYIVARAMAEALSNAREKCARYLSSGRLTDNNSLEDITGSFVLTLSMPDRWNFGATTKLTNSIHNHAVSFCLFSIFEKTNPDEAKNYFDKSTMELNGIKPILELRTGPVRASSTNLY